MSSAIKRGHPLFFGAILLFDFIELVMSAFLVGKFNDNGYPFDSTSVRDRLRFILFTSIWTFVFTIAYIVFFLTAAGSFLASIASHGIFIFLTWVFWLCGAAAITSAYGGGLSCGDYPYSYCTTQDAVEGFAWLLWIFFTFALLLILFVGARSARSGSGYGGALAE